MKNLLSFMKPQEPVSEKKGAYVLSYTIAGITDCFDANEIWSQPGFIRHNQNRLRGLLEAQTFRRGNAKQTHEHVIIELPAAAVADDRRIGCGETCKMLERELAQLHFDAFKSGTPRYQVRAALDLADDEVRVRLGHGIYLPAADETRAWKLECSIDGTIWCELADLTQNQRLVVLGSQTGSASYICPDWPFGDAVHLVLINAAEQSELDISSQPLSHLQVRLDEELGYHVIEDQHGQAGKTRFYLRASRTARHLPTPPASATLAPAKRPAAPVSASTQAATPIKPAAESPVRREPHMPPVPDKTALNPPEANPASSLAVWRKGQPMAAPQPTAEEAEGTFVPGRQAAPSAETSETWVVGVVPLHQPKLALVGLALQRPSLYQEYGIRSLNFGLDAQGRVRPPQDATCALRFTILPDDSLFVETKNGKRSLKPGEKLPLPAGGTVALHELPQAMQARHMAWLALPNGPGAALSTGKELTVGRDRRFVDLAALRLLAGKGFIQADSNPGGDCMGISSEHCKIMLADQTLSIAVQGKMPLTLLDADFNFMRMLGQGEQAHLTHGQYLVLGHYVWQFRLAPGGALSK